MKIAFLFAGQGSQHENMGKDLYDNIPLIHEQMDKFEEIRDLCFNASKEDLDQTQFAQPAILLESVVIANYLKSMGIEPAMVAGLSLGEYSALAFSEAWSLADAIDIIKYRGWIMQTALPMGASAMAAIIGLAEEQIRPVIQQVNGICEIANFNCPGQIVISGEANAIDEACGLLKEAGARRALKLNVSGAFHSSLLNDASLKLRKMLDSYTPSRPKYEVVYNVFGTPSDLELNSILERQIKSSVYFMQSISYMINQGVDTFIEIGPGAALSGFVKKMSKDVQVYQTNTLQDVLKVIEEMKK